MSRDLPLVFSDQRCRRLLTSRSLVFDSFLSIHMCHADEKDKEFELEMTWICPESKGRHVLVPADLLAEAEAKAKESLSVPNLLSYLSLLLPAALELLTHFLTHILQGRGHGGLDAFRVGLRHEMETSEPQRGARSRWHGFFTSFPRTCTRLRRLFPCSQQE